MKTLICHSGHISAHDSSNVSVRMMREMIAHLRKGGDEVEYLSVISQPDARSARVFQQVKGTKWDTILVFYSSWYVHLDTVAELLETNADTPRGWVTSEYELHQHLAWNPYHYVISNFDEVFYKKKKKFYDRYFMMNLNAMVFREDRDLVITDKTEGAIYYGRFRKGRAKYFAQYLKDPIVVSTTKKNVRLFRQVGCTATIFDRLSWVGTPTLSRFKASIYLEDELTHTVYNHLGTRFYEALNCGTMPIFGVECQGTIDKSEYEVPEWAVTEDMVSTTGNLKPKKVKEWLTYAREVAAKEKRVALAELSASLHSIHRVS